MKKISLCLLILIFTVSCTTSKIKRSEIRLFHRALPPEGSISIIDYTRDWVEFRVRIKFKAKRLYKKLFKNITGGLKCPKEF